MAKSKPISYSIGDAQRFNEIIKTNEEMQAIIISVLTAVENEADTDTFLLCPRNSAHFTGSRK